MDRDKLLNYAYELSQLIVNSEAFRLYRKLEQDIKNNKETSELLTKFNYEKERFYQASQYGEYYPDFSEIKKQFQTAKITLMNDPLFKQYKECERTVEKLVIEIETKIKNSLNIVDKHGNKSMLIVG